MIEQSHVLLGSGCRGGGCSMCVAPCYHHHPDGVVRVDESDLNMSVTGSETGCVPLVEHTNCDSLNECDPLNCRLFAESATSEDTSAKRHVKGWNPTLSAC